MLLSAIALYSSGGYSVDAKSAINVKVTERKEQPGRLNENLRSEVVFEGLVAGGVQIANDSVGHVGADVKGRGSSGQ